MTASARSAELASIIAHRGASGDAPENTLGALSLAVDQGASCVEIDVSISCDDVPYVHHDDTLDRCTSGSGLLCEHSSAQLDQLTAGKSFPGYEQEALPRLSAVIQFLVRHDIGLNLEIKPRAGLEQRTCEAITDLMRSAWPDHLPLVYSSFSRDSLGYAFALAPEVPRGLLVEHIPRNLFELTDRYACQNVHCDGAKLAHSNAQLVKSGELGLYCYTVNDVNRAQKLFDWGVDGVITDFPKRLFLAMENS